MQVSAYVDTPSWRAFLPIKSHISLQIDTRLFSVDLEADAACIRIAAALL